MTTATAKKTATAKTTDTATAKGKAPEKKTETAAATQLVVAKVFPVRQKTLRHVAQVAMDRASKGGKQPFTAASFREQLAPVAKELGVREPTVGWAKHNFPTWIVTAGWAKPAK